MALTEYTLTKGYTLIFRHDVLNIFTDASKAPVTVNSFASGCYAVSIPIWSKKEEILEDKIEMCPIGSTNNYAEAHAILLGCQLAYKLINKYPGQFKYINLFSDSQINVLGARDRAFGYMHNPLQDGMLTTNTGAVWANQGKLLEIIYYITETGMDINLYHIKGHVNINSQDSLQDAANCFIANYTKATRVASSLVERVSYYNNGIDNLTRKAAMSGEYEPVIHPIEACYMEDFDMNPFIEHTRKGGVFNYYRKDVKNKKPEVYFTKTN